MGSSSVLTAPNPGMPFDQAWIDLAPQSASFESAVQDSTPSKEDIKVLASVFDLTSLGSDDTDERIQNLFADALEPLPGQRDKVAGLCIYPRFLHLAGTWMSANNVRLVTVAGAFPHGLGTLDSRCEEISECAKLADEVDVPIDRRLVLQQDWQQLYWETKELVSAARGVPVKVILATGELPDQRTMYRAAIVAMMAGAAFVKTSTGKERVNATLDAGAILCRAIKDYAKRTDAKVGLKPAGGIRTTREAASWLQLVRLRLGEEWVSPALFRIGASALLGHLRFSMQSGDLSA